MAFFVAWRSIRWLFGALDVDRLHHPGALELAAAATAFLCFSIGTALVLLGGHLADPVEVSRRWAKRRADR